MVLVSYFSVLIGLSFSHIGYYLNVFDGLWKIGSGTSTRDRHIAIAHAAL